MVPYSHGPYLVCQRHCTFVLGAGSWIRGWSLCGVLSVALKALSDCVLASAVHLYNWPALTGDAATHLPLSRKEGLN